jgi:stress-induced morphogen
MSRANSIEQRIGAALAPVHLEIHDESHMHSSGKGAESHFRLVVVAEAFAGKSLVQRHKLVYSAVGDELRAGLHALAITSRTPAEWQANAQVAASPACAGGSGR